MSTSTRQARTGQRTLAGLRIVTGSGGEFHWTRDHYDSFERIAR